MSAAMIASDRRWTLWKCSLLQMKDVLGAILHGLLNSWIVMGDVKHTCSAGGDSGEVDDRVTEEAGSWLPCLARADGPDSVGLQLATSYSTLLDLLGH